MTAASKSSSINSTLKVPGGPPEGWDKWSSDRALETDYVIIIGTEAWFQCFEKKQKPGTGLGAACEADDIRHRIYKANGIVETIRVVLFDKADAHHIPAKLERYHRFHAEHDFDNIIKWLKPPQAAPAAATSPSSLPRLHFFFGREKELKTIADALSPKARTWGALIDGPGGMGKTTLAIRAAELATPGQFKHIIFLSAKEREMTADGKRALTGFVLPSFLQMLNELADKIGRPELARLPEDERIAKLHDALATESALLLLDNLESLSPEHRDQVFTFLSRLPTGCKAIVTSRRRSDTDARIIRLDRLDKEAALLLLAELATDRPLLLKASIPERETLYEETGGNPLLMRWLAGQLGKGRCKTVAKALEFIRSAQADNDPLEFIFGDLLRPSLLRRRKCLCAHLLHLPSGDQVDC